MARFIVKEVSSKKILVNSEIIIYGYGFDYTCKVWLGDNSLKVYDYSSTFIKVNVSKNIGIHPLYVGYSVVDRVEISKIIVTGNSYELELPFPRVPVLSSLQDLILQLLPNGFAWYKGSDGNFAKLAKGLAEVPYSLFSQIIQIVKERSAAHSENLFPYEKDLALPEEGSKMHSNSERKAEIIKKLRREHTCTVPYLNEALKIFGKKIDIYEYWKSPERFITVDFDGKEPNYYFAVAQVYSDDDVIYATCNSDCNSYLADWSQPNIENFVIKNKPAHTEVVFTYTYQSLKHLVLYDTMFSTARMASSGITFGADFEGAKANTQMLDSYYRRGEEVASASASASASILDSSLSEIEN